MQKHRPAAKMRKRPDSRPRPPGERGRGWGLRWPSWQCIKRAATVVARTGCSSAPASARTIPTPVPAERRRRKMQVSYFENGRYYAPTNLPRQWPMPAGAYDRDAGLRAFRGMVERSRYAEELGYDWVSISEHHYSPRIPDPVAADRGGLPRLARA